MSFNGLDKNKSCQSKDGKFVSEHFLCEVALLSCLLLGRLEKSTKLNGYSTEIAPLLYRRFHGEPREFANIFQHLISVGRHELALPAKLFHIFLRFPVSSRKWNNFATI